MPAEPTATDTAPVPPEDTATDEEREEVDPDDTAPADTSPPDDSGATGDTGSGGDTGPPNDTGEGPPSDPCAGVQEITTQGLTATIDGSTVAYTDGYWLSTFLYGSWNDSAAGLARVLSIAADGELDVPGERRLVSASSTTQVGGQKPTTWSFEGAGPAVTVCAVIGNAGWGVLPGPVVLHGNAGKVVLEDVVWTAWPAF